ncbi:MAG: hypothetical protein P8Y97_22040, partial [Candidatus Lokiarchaeota archaeon]
SGPRIPGNDIIDYESTELREDQVDFKEKDDEIIKRVTCEYELIPPLLPRSAKIVKNKKKLKNIPEFKRLLKKNVEIYENDNVYYLIVKNKEELKDLMKIVKNNNFRLVTLEKFIK